MTKSEDLAASWREKVARALCKRDGMDPDALSSWGGEWQLWTEYEDDADAVVAVILADLEPLRELSESASEKWELVDLQAMSMNGRLEDIGVKALKLEGDICGSGGLGVPSEDAELAFASVKFVRSILAWGAK